MAFHRFQNLPVELRLQIWECAVDAALLIDVLLTDKQKPVCHMVAPQSSPDPTTELVTYEYLALGHVCHESREVFRRHGGRVADARADARDYIPTTDVVYIDDYDDWIAMDRSLQLKVRHIALSAYFCYDMLRIEGPSPTVFDQLGWPHGSRRSFTTSPNSDFFSFTLICCPDLESISIVLPPLENNMPHYAEKFPVETGPSFLKIVPYSEIRKIKIRGPSTYTSWLRGSANTKRLFLGPFIKDVNEVWKKDTDRKLDDDDHRRAITVQVGVVQYLEGPCEGKWRLSSIYKEAEELEENQTANYDGEVY